MRLTIALIAMVFLHEWNPHPSFTAMMSMTLTIIYAFVMDMAHLTKKRNPK